MQQAHEQDSQTVTTVKKPVEIFDILTDADYARLCREQIEHENVLAECIMSIEEIKTAMKKPREDAQRKIEQIHNTIVAGKERREVQCELRFVWKENRVEYWRIDGQEPVHITSLDRQITDEERKLRLPITVMLKITGNANSHSVMLSGKELVVLESFREIPYSQNHFKWGDESNETKQLAAAILLKFLEKDKAAKLVDKFTKGMLCIVPSSKDLSLALDMDQWIIENSTEDATEEKTKPSTKRGKKENGEEAAESD